MKKVMLLILALCLLVLPACSNEQPGDTTPSGTQGTTEGTEAGLDFSKFENKTTILCYNIYYKDVASRAENIQKLMLRENADVMMLQEVSVDWIPYLQQYMKDNGYSYYGYGRYGGELSGENLQSGDQFLPILWKTEKYDLVESGHFWLSSTPTEVKSAAWVDGTVSKYPRCVNWVILKDKQTGGEFMALNIHTDPESDRVRTLSCALAVEQAEKIRGDRPVVLAGDWNMGLTDTGYSVVTESFQDIRFKAVDTMHGGSFNAWGERKEGNFAYGDHMFMSEDMAAEKFAVLDDIYDGEHISDHCPLLAILYY